MNPTKSSPSNKRESVVISVLLVILTVLVFAPVLNYGFINYDDPDFVTQNPRIQQGLTWQNTVWAFGSLHIYWQPLTWISYMVDVEFWGMNPRGFHLTNLLLHVANTLLLFLVLKRMTKAVWLSGFVAALFALHPLHVETAVWIAERKGVLCTVWWLLAMWSYVRYAERPGWLRYLWVCGFFALGLMSKSMVVTLPCVFLLLDVWPLRRLQWLERRSSTGRPETARAIKPSLLVLEKLPLLAMALVSSFLTVVAQKKSMAVLSLEQFSVADRLGHALLGYLAYLRKTLWPSDLTVFYPFPETLPLWKVLLAVVVLGGVSLIAVAQAKRRPWLLVGWLWFVGTLVPVIGLFQVGDQAIADRYTYIPLIGLFVAVAWTVVDIVRTKRPQLAFGVPALAAVAACVWVSGTQVRHWRSTQALFEHGARVTSRNFVAHAVLGHIATEQGNWAEAERLYRQALAFKETYADGHYAFAVALEKNGKVDNAISHYRRALEMNPAWAEARSGLGSAFMRQNKFTEAAAEFAAAIDQKPDLRVAHVNLAIAWHLAGRTDDAVAVYANLAGFPRGAPSAYLSFGNLLAVRGHVAAAAPCYRKVLEGEPDSVDALRRLAWIYATHADPAVRNGAEGVRLATRACELTRFNDALALNSLAAAYAETGQFAKAAETAQNALNLANASGPKGVAPVIQQILTLSRTEKPFREQPPR